MVSSFLFYVLLVPLTHMCGTYIMWTVIFHFGRAHSQILTFTSATEAKKAIDIAVFNNKDCVNAQVFRTGKEN